MITDRDLNLLESCANWLETRSETFYFAAYKHLMKEYAMKLKDLRERLAPQAVEKPIFGKKSDA